MPKKKKKKNKTIKFTKKNIFLHLSETKTNNFNPVNSCLLTAGQAGS